MTTWFPPTEEIALDSPPLKEVICQIRFPPILQIASELPIDFQGKVRQRFPNLEVEQGIEIAFAPLVETDTLARAKPKLYHFGSPEGSSKITLAADFYAVSTNHYRHWRDFVADLQYAHDAMMQVYSPSHATRIGLRYVNSFSNDSTHTETREELLDLFNPKLTDLLRGEVGANAEELASRLSFVEEPARLNLQFSYNEGNGEFVIDLDYFEKGNIQLGEVVERCRQYHDIVYRAFRWCVPASTLQPFVTAS
jgi:uncharacterized protein (TIGR04255 family)